MNVRWGDVWDVEDAPLAREEIDLSSDLEQLLEWRVFAEARLIELKAFMAARKEAGYAPEQLEKLVGRLAFSRMGLEWIDRRIVALGAFPPKDPRKHQITLLIQKVKKLEEQLAVAKAVAA